MFDLRLNIIRPLSIVNNEINFYEKLGDITCVLAEICDLFEETSKVEFFVSGFGQNKWPTDCRTDLLTIIEQIPDILKTIHKDEYTFSLDFYEQGLERELVFEDASSFVKVNCYSRTKWRPIPQYLVLEKKKVKSLMIELYRDFFKIANIVCKSIADNSIFLEWTNIIDQLIE